MFKNARISKPLVDPGLYALAHSQDFLAPAFLTRELPVLPKWQYHHPFHRRCPARASTKHRRKAFKQKKILSLQGELL